MACDSDLLFVVGHEGGCLDALLPVAVVQLLVVELCSTFTASARHGSGGSGGCDDGGGSMVVVGGQGV